MSHWEDKQNNHSSLRTILEIAVNQFFEGLMSSLINIDKENRTIQASIFPIPLHIKPKCGKDKIMDFIYALVSGCETRCELIAKCVRPCPPFSLLRRLRGQSSWLDYPHT